MIVLERDNKIVVASQAFLLEQDREMAWAEDLVRHNPAYAWVLGRYVSAGQEPNANGHIFSVEELRTAKDTLVYAPMNLLHRPRQILGAYVGAEVVYPASAEASVSAGAGLDVGSDPFLESLAAFWRFYFPEEHDLIRDCHGAGLLAQSMECVPESVTCATEGCGKSFAYAGRTHETYCDHLKAPGSPRPPRHLNKPHFTAGALVIPPAKPAWSGATVSELSAVVREQLDAAEKEGVADELYREAATEFSHLDTPQWEAVMAAVMAAAAPTSAQEAVTAPPVAATVARARTELAALPVFDPAIGRSFSAEERRRLATQGKAMADGSMPIETVEDLRNAIRLAGNHKNPAAARAHIRRRAKALGASGLIPEGWK